jgi:hypothetical protein
MSYNILYEITNTFGQLQDLKPIHCATTPFVLTVVNNYMKPLRKLLFHGVIHDECFMKSIASICSGFYWLCLSNG